MSKELDKTYNPKEIEQRLYKKWEDNKYFSAKVNPDRKPFTIVMPPPNITGQLHMGHALDNTLQDIITRFKRMQGYEALWLPGTDHASIATEAKVVESLRQQGISKESLGREGFLKKAWEWREEYGRRIVTQLRKLGSSCDWDRERFTMDEGCSRAVKEVFVNLYNKKLIYRGNRMVNWCPKCNTSISDAEVEHEEKQAAFYHILYPVKETGEMLELATTRPETMLGDTAVAINEADPRYAHLHGCHVILPIVGKEIPIVCDEHADMEKGTGVVKITPAHDPNDFEVGKRHNLPAVRMLTYDGYMTGAADAAAYAQLVAEGKATEGEPEVIDCGKYAGMSAGQARTAIIEELKQLGNLKEIEPLTHEVGTCYRCGTVIEPMISKQWFVRMQPLAEPAIKAVEDGGIRYVPDRFTKTYLNWMYGTRDWCISRQLWWGHQIPAWYCGDCGEMVVSKDEPAACPKCGGRLTQDPDTLDTWFSSALWPFSTLGWPDETEDFKYFYPTQTLVTGYDIIGFWVSRMIFSGLAYTDKAPFDTVLIHGLVRDSQGRKMSKSLGNGIDPLEVIDKYGADALRMMLMTGNAPGNDMRFYWEKVEACRNFANKVWNASRFIMINMDSVDMSAYSPEALEATDKWILSKTNKVIRIVTENIEKYELGIALQNIYDFVWDELCDWYIEMVKPRFWGDDPASKAAAAHTLGKVLIDSLKLLHPYMPFITEEIFCNLQDEEETIMRSSWPVYDPANEFPSEESDIELVKEAVRKIRELRLSLNVPPSRKAKVFLVSGDADIRESFARCEEVFKRLAGASELAAQADKTGIADSAVSAVISGAVIYMPLEELVDLDKERERLKKEEEKILASIDRSNGMLNNENFMKKAPAAKIAEEQENLAKYTEMLQKVREQLSRI